MNQEEMLKHLKNGISPLEVSIMKWEELRDNPHNTADIGEGTCALCYVRSSNCESDIRNSNCENNCPVFIQTRHVGCSHTPYGHFAMNRTKYNASRMVAFLKSLRDE